MILNYNYCLKAEGALRSRDRIEDIVGRVFSDSVRLLPPIYLIVGMIQNLLFVRPTACSLAKFGGSYDRGQSWRSYDHGISLALLR